MQNRIDKLFAYHNFSIAADLFDKENMTAKLINVQEREEITARCRSPITKEMCVIMAKLTNESDQDSVESVTHD